MVVIDIRAVTNRPELTAIRAAMAAALERDDRAEYHRLGAEHRRLLHEANPALKTAWEACR